MTDGLYIVWISVFLSAIVGNQPRHHVMFHFHGLKNSYRRVAATQFAEQKIHSFIFILLIPSGVARCHKMSTANITSLSDFTVFLTIVKTKGRLLWLRLGDF